MKIELTEIEKRYASVLLLRKPVLPGFNPHDSYWWPLIRKEMRDIAYHEAGHFVAKCFTGLEKYHVVAVSIIGNEERGGYVNSERPFTRMMLESYPPPLQRSNGRMLLLHALAGLGAEIILKFYDSGGSEKWDDVFEYWDLNTFFDENHDISEAFCIANIMAKPLMPAEKILELANKWTLEMLAIPAVWNCVKAVANKLIEKGEITDEIGLDELYKFSHTPDFPDIYTLPKWDKRLLIQPGELKKYYLPMSREESLAMLSK